MAKNRDDACAEVGREGAGCHLRLQYCKSLPSPCLATWGLIRLGGVCVVIHHLIIRRFLKPISRVTIVRKPWEFSSLTAISVVRFNGLVSETSSKLTMQSFSCVVSHKLVSKKLCLNH